MTRPPSDPRSLASWVVERTLASKSPANLFLRQAGRVLDPRDRRLLEELSLGTLRWLRRLDHVLEAASSRRLASVDPRVRVPLRVGAYQLLYLDRVPAHAAVHRAVEEAKLKAHRGAAGFVNAVLRKIAAAPRLDDWPITEGTAMQRLGIAHSHPDFLVERWTAHFGEQRTRDLLEINNQRKPIQMLTFSARGGRDLVAQALGEEGISTVRSTLSPIGLTVVEGDPRTTRCWRQGQIYLQDAASQAASLVPPPLAGERVLDLAAAPGGKSFSLRAFEPGLRQVAADRDLDRLEIMRANRDRLGLPIWLVQADGMRPPWRASFDRVVLDLPCTGTGTLRKSPELKWRIDESEIERLSGQSLRLLLAASGLARPGGLMVVVTCSLEPEENAELIQRFLTRRPAFEPAEIGDRLPDLMRHGWLGGGMWQVLPANEHDGFTVHVLRRRH